MGKAKERGLITKIARKYGKTISQIKAELMRKATSYAKQFIKEVLGVDFKTLPPDVKLAVWIPALRIILPKFWEVARAKDDVPTYEEVIAKVTDAEKAKLKAIYEAVSKALGAVA